MICSLFSHFLKCGAGHERQKERRERQRQEKALTDKAALLPFRGFFV